MGNLAGLWPALQSIGIVGILVVVLVAVSRGAYIPRAGHEEALAQQALLIAELSREVQKLEETVNRLQAALAAKSGDDD
jgi:hypothetical protein